MSRQLVYLAIWSFAFSVTTCLAFGQAHFPPPDEETCEPASRMRRVDRLDARGRFGSLSSNIGAWGTAVTYPNHQ